MPISVSYTHTHQNPRYGNIMILHFKKNVSWFSVRFLSVHCYVAFRSPSKVNKTQIAAASLVYAFVSVRSELDAWVLFHSVLRMWETGLCRVVWNVHEAITVGTKLVSHVPLSEFVSPQVNTVNSVLAVAIYRRFVREMGYYITMHCRSPCSREIILA